MVMTVTKVCLCKIASWVCMERNIYDYGSDKTIYFLAYVNQQVMYCIQIDGGNELASKYV